MDAELVNRAVFSAPGEGQKIGNFRLRLSSAQTGGAIEAFEHFDVGFPPPHIHHDHDEFFYIIEGSVKLTLGKEEVEAPAGTLAFVPRGMRHSFKPNEGARMLVFVIPAGLEGFFKEMDERLASGQANPAVRAALAGKYDSWPTG